MKAPGFKEYHRAEVVDKEPPGAIRRQLKVALAGQPNVGKSTIFNLITGLNQHVGNWPGKTVEYKAGIYHHGDTVFQIVDLPGTYSLTANSQEERIARDYIIHERPDVVVAIVNAAKLEHSLYLVAELLYLQAPMIVGLNMMDVASQQGIKIEPPVLEAALGLPVLPLIATKNQGVSELIQRIEHLVDHPGDYTPTRPAIRQDHWEVLERLYALVAEHIPEPYPKEWVAIKLLEGDDEITSMAMEWLSADQWELVHTILKQHEDAILAIAGGRYDWIGRMMRAAVVNPPAGQITLTDRLDRIATHPMLGLIVLLGVFGLTFWLTYTLASPIQNWLDTMLVEGCARWIRESFHDLPSWLVSLLAEGVITGAGTVLTLLPVLVVFFSMLAVLEDIGYLARAAFVMDRFMHPMGLHGKSSLTLCMGFGCNVPAVLGARIIETQPGRLQTILLAPLVPCSARLAVLAFLTPVFFPGHPALVSLGLIALNLLVLAVFGITAHHFLLRDEQMAFIMELPLYHLPNLRTIGVQVWRRSLSFLRHAGTIIPLVSTLVWALAFLPGLGIERSWLAQVGRFLEPVGRLMGLDWRMIIALFTSFVAKENTIATLGVLYQPGAGVVDLGQTLANNIPPAAALAFLALQMLFIPCAATVAVMLQELRDWRWVLFEVALLLGISFGVGMAIYQVLTLCILPYWYS